MSQPRVLYQLQEIEHGITATQKRLNEIHDILTSDAAVTAAQAAVEQAEAELKPLNTQAKNLELEIETTSTKATEAEDHLYSGSVKNPKEMQEIQQEITALKARKDELEEITLELMERIETAETTLQQKRDELDRVKKARAAENEALVLEQESQQDKLNRLKAERQSTIERVDPANLKLYEQLKARTRGTAVTKMNADATCSRCGVQQTRTAEGDIRRGKLQQCSNCRRILVYL